MFHFRRVRLRAGLAALAVAACGTPAMATVTFTVAGTSSAGNPVAFQADLAISGNLLTIDLFNTSPVDSVAPADVLSSFYFDIVQGGTARPTLGYLSASGTVWQVRQAANDLPYDYSPPSVSGTAVYQLATGTVPHVASNLMATGVGDRTWQFRAMNSGSVPFLGFGIGTVGNSNFPGNGFNPQIVGPPGNSMIAFSIYRDGNIEPVNNLAGEFIVENRARFTFLGVCGFTEADIKQHAVFGLGTGPDSIISVPEHSTVGLALVAACGGLGLALARRRPRGGRVRRGGAWRLGVAAAVGLCLLTAAPARAVPVVPVIPVANYDFSIDGQGWTSQTFTYFSPTTPVAGSSVNHWTYAAAADVWEVDPKAVFSSAAWIVNTLTSPVITIPAQVDQLDFVIRHRFNFPTNITTGNPVVAGEVAWRFYDPAKPNAPFQPFLPAKFATGAVSPPYQSLSPYPDWVPPNYTVGSFGVPPLLATGGAWKGQSPGWLSGQFVLSEVTLDGGLSIGDQIQFRFLNANLGVECTGGGWDVSRVDVTGQFLPEPGGLALAGIAAGVGGCLGLRRRLRRRHQRASSPSVSPLTNTLPPVSID